MLSSAATGATEAQVVPAKEAAVGRPWRPWHVKGEQGNAGPRGRGSGSRKAKPSS